ncbi:hypothetical protein [Paraburkholderia hospita]|uniref:hypothetical protein n=1 Tax=Paraburkholderia hospita TaxID=169430 RepID=UPI0008A7BE82|nr:hypothetical protein [Paraburkholderia hospita]SEH89213.1 hypothetical protein SAMN05192544_1011107 [Paraburkholderia hospita]
MSDVQPLFHGEVQLAAWSESHTGGAKIVLWLSDPADLEAFRVMTVRKGNVAGQRMACALVEIGDDEQPVQPVQQAAENPKGGPLAKLAGMWCDNPKFWEWIRSKGARCTGHEEAAQIIRKTCKIGSRAELDSNREAASVFNEMFRKPFGYWMSGAQ